ncbi:glycoside hydrolase family 9 protein [Cognataquiflexum aquatile]|uniref:glycoside hydrolase family 9 protein n=1 Tax=Cognataquiflexum aquatile TaxID=2249427 RepID=UPI000DEA7261|nr:glycoside hydrolase family 9 protein [Cognataquiflexum aquatile]
MLLNFKTLSVFLILLNNLFSNEETHIRINQLGYLPSDTKVAVVFSKNTVKENFQLINQATGKVALEIKPERLQTNEWGGFLYWEADFSQVTEPGAYFLQGKKSKSQSSVFPIGEEAYTGQQESLLEFMRQQRCGYNPTLDMVCHAKDGRTFFGPKADSTYVDLSGGWHDAGDQLKYLITSSYATAHMLMAYELYPDRFEDKVNALGQSGPNGIADVLDEAKWGLDWILKMHPAPDQLFHQVADDRDHRGFKIPNKDNADYGWGANSYRAAYFATGKPQGLMKYQSEATGVANLAGRSAAALALASRIWEKDLKDPEFAGTCRKAAISLYQMGRKQEGYQQGNSYGAPYRYNEETWADDMEWAAAELYKTTKDKNYLEQAKKYAVLSNTSDSWTVKDSASHYQLYPFINMGHFALHGVVDADFKKTLEGYYFDGIKYTLKRAQQNPFHVGVPFIWCSNNLLTSLATQVILYEKMSGDKQFEPFLNAQRDWLFGRNPWGTSMFTKMPERGEYPVEVHTAPFVLLGMQVPGGLVDGPVYTSIYNNLLGLRLLKPDVFAQFQNEHVVYHDDVGDYSTNEPTMDGTAGSILMMTHFSKGK